MLTLNDGRDELWQWDTGRTLAVDADCSQVHFSNKVFGRSIDVDVVDGVATIPDILLQTDKDLNVWAFVGTAENGYTKISKTFKVNRRNKPADYVFTHPDQTSIEEIKERLEYLEQNPVEAPVQSVNGKTGAVELTAEDVGAISDETDPTVPDWAKQPTKPSYTSEEVGARSADWMPTAAEVGALPTTYTPPDQTAEQVGADPAGTAASAVSQHNTDVTSHNDLRLALKWLSDRINVVLDSDDTSLDQMSEVVEYIKSNKSMIDAITTSKVSVADIVDNLTTNVANKPLSAAQGVALKAIIDALTIPTALSDLTEDTTHRVVTDAEKAVWNSKSNFTGSYNDLTDKPTIPSKTSQLTNDSGFLTSHQSLAGYATEQYVNNHHDSTKQDVISDLYTIRSGASKGATAYQKPTGGIPKIDLASGVQASLEKADTSVQTDDLDDYALKSDLPINVKDYGAVGDGVTDDTTSVQNALNVAQGKTLIIDGVCKITSPLTVKDNTKIIGIGSRASGFDSYVAGTLFTSANDKGIYQCLFRNLRIRNRNLSPTDTDGQYIGQVFSSLYESRVTECYVEHFAQICSRMARISSIDHCEMYYVNKSLVNDVIDSMIESNYINARNTAAGRTIMVYGLFSNSMLTNNFCDYWGAAFRLEPGSKPSNVVGNTFDNCVSVFRDYVAALSIVGNNYTNIKYVSANWQAGGQPPAKIQATKWSVFKFDGATASHTGASKQCSLLDTTFNSNTFGNCSYYIDVENGVSVYPVQRCKFADNAWEGLLVDAGFANPQNAYDNGGMRTVYFDFWEGQSVDVLPSANLVSNSAKSIFSYDGLNLWYKKRAIRNFNGAWRFTDGSILSNEIWDLADRTYLSRTVAANTPRTYSTEHWYKVGYNGSEYTDTGYASNPIVSNISKNGFTIQTKNTLTGLGFYLPYGEFTFTATLPTGIEAYLLVVPASGTLESRNKVASGATLKCNDVSKSYVLLFCSRTTIGTYSVSNVRIRDNSYAEVSTAPYYQKEESQTKSIADIAGYYTSDTVEGALAEIGGTLDELKAAINTIRGG